MTVLNSLTVNLAQTGEFVEPSVNWMLLSPLVIVFGGAVIGVLIEAFAPRKSRRMINAVWSLLIVVGAFVAVVAQWVKIAGVEMTYAEASKQLTGQYVGDTWTVALQGIVLIVAALALLIVVDRTRLKDGAFAAQPSDRPGSGEEALSLAKQYQRSEIFPLLLFSLGGMMMFPATQSLLTMFVALEVMSLPLYVLVATARHRREESQEAALKYFILGAFASAFFLMGAAMLFGYSGGSLDFNVIAQAIPLVNNMEWLLLVGVLFVLVGLLFKVAAFPFHAWTPDVYTGAPTPITGFMAAGVKIAAFGALLRFYQSVAAALQWDFRMLLAVATAATIIFGTVVGLVQKDIKRMLAYSSIAHAGFLLIGVLSLVAGSAASIAFYLLSYGIATVGAFGVMTLVRRKNSDGGIGAEATRISDWKGLGKRSRLLAGAMLVFLLSFAGIPFTSGFVGKFLVFADGIGGGLGWLVGIALAASAATAVFYFRVIANMFFKKPEEDVTVVGAQGFTDIAVGFAAFVTVLLGVIPGPVISLLEKIVILLP